MAKQGMARPDRTKRPKNEAPPVPELQGKAKTGKEKAISRRSYSTIDTDLARDNLENDLTFADRQDV